MTAKRAAVSWFQRSFISSWVTTSKSSASPGRSPRRARIRPVTWSIEPASPAAGFATTVSQTRSSKEIQRTSFIMYFCAVLNGTKARLPPSVAKRLGGCLYTPTILKL